MASIRREIHVEAGAEQVWEAIAANELASPIAALIDQGMAVMKKTLESPVEVG